MRAPSVLLLLLALVSPAAAEDDPVLDRLGSLAGTWDGEFTWSGARSGGGELDVEYYLTGGGSAVVENHVGPGGAYMTSVYHRDGDDLRLTHYCAAKNQPRMKAG